MSAYRYLIDVNLPKYFSFFNSPEFEFVVDINSKWPDRDIWDYARERELVIVTKDSDFYHRCLLDKQPAKVIHLRLGNLLLKDLHAFFQNNWEQITGHLHHARMIIVTADGIEVFPY
jgi:predicted nuclease of predicted toxin-antitoxin system